MYVCMYLYVWYMHEYVRAKSQSDSLSPHGPQPARLLCPWDSPGKNTGVGCPALLQGIFLTQRSNLCLLHLPALAGGLFTPSATWEAHIYSYIHINISYKRKIIQLTLQRENTYLMPIRWLYAGTVLGTGKMALINIDKHPFPHRDSITVEK